MPQPNAFPHVMLKEIYEQPEVMRRTMAAYLQPDGSGQVQPQLRQLGLSVDQALSLQQVNILASGTSRHAGLAAQHWLEQLVGITTRIRSGSEYQAAPLPLTPHTLTIGITQSGETADTLRALHLEKSRRAVREANDSFLLGVTNHADSSLAQLVDVTLPTLAGQEVGVAATKTFTAQLLVLFCWAMAVAMQRQALPRDRTLALLHELQHLPGKIEQILGQASAIQTLAERFHGVQSCVLLGQGLNRAIALEGALKLKETTYIHAEGYAAGEFLHGPAALLDSTIPVVAIAPYGSTAETVVSVVRSLKTCKAPLLGITTSSLPDPQAVFDAHVIMPDTDELLSPFLTVIPLQLLAYHIAVQRQLNVDCPRHITKVVLD